MDLQSDSTNKKGLRPFEPKLGQRYLVRPKSQHDREADLDDVLGAWLKEDLNPMALVHLNNIDNVVCLEPSKKQQGVLPKLYHTGLVVSSYWHGTGCTMHASN